MARASAARSRPSTSRATGVRQSPRSSRWPTCRNGRWPWCCRRRRDRRRSGSGPDNDIEGKLLPDRKTGTINAADSKWVGKKFSTLGVGDVVYVAPVDGKDGSYALQQVPEIEGALVAMDPRTGRVLAMVGGFSYAESEFNRATQALRQPGSSFKPIVYSAALDNGYTPASVVLDAPIEVVNSDGTVWKPDNFEKDFKGPQTLRRGIELSRNVMTVRLAQDIGMPLIAEYAKMFGIYDKLTPVLAMALGAGETTDMKMTAAYATIANGGRKIVPTLIDRIQDRYGKTIYKHDDRVCDGCIAPSWAHQSEPLIIDNREQVLDPMTAYQITSMMEGVVQRGTGTYARRLNRPVAGKTGTTSDSRDVWFIGFTPELVAGVYLGYDKPKSLGNEADRRRTCRAGVHRVHAGCAQGQAANTIQHAIRHDADLDRPSHWRQSQCRRHGDCRSVQTGHRPKPRDLGDRRQLQCLQWPATTAPASPTQLQRTRYRRRPAAAGGYQQRRRQRFRPRLPVRPGRPVLSDFVRYPDPRLEASAALAHGVDDTLRGIGERLLAAAMSSGAFGLAAVHMGDVAPVVVVSDGSAAGQRRLLFNPRVVAVAETSEKGEEGSVSLPGVAGRDRAPGLGADRLHGRDRRPAQVRFEGFAARVALHEIEQMQGIFFLDRVSRLKRDMALKKARKAAG